jgi:hypothetical protein
MPVLSLNVGLNLVFLASACVAFFSMLHLLGAPHTPHARILRIVHRTAGGIAVAAYVVLGIICVVGVVREGFGTGAAPALRLTFSAVFIPFVLAKVVVVEKYPELRNKLFGIGLTLFAAVFVIVLTSAAPMLKSPAEQSGAEGQGPSARELALGREIFVVKCSRCHRLDRPLSADKTAEEWGRTVTEMRMKDPAWISAPEAERIASFLINLVGETNDD